MHSITKTDLLRALRMAMIAPATLGLLTACNTSSNRQLQQEAAQQTIAAKRDSKEALQNARVAAADAEQKVNAIAAGVKEGIHDKAGPGSSDSRIDLNSASAADLATLPGISDAKARQIVRHRPYSSGRQLVTRGLLTESQYTAIAPDLTAQ